MRFEPREEDPNVNILLQSGIAMGDDKGKQLEDNSWFRKALAKETESYLKHKTFMEEKKSFAKASVSGSRDKPNQEMDRSMLTTFLETWMKLLCDRKAMKGL